MEHNIMPDQQGWKVTSRDPIWIEIGNFRATIIYICECADLDPAKEGLITWSRSDLLQLLSTFMRRSSSQSNGTYTYTPPHAWIVALKIKNSRIVFDLSFDPYIAFSFGFFNYPTINIRTIMRFWNPFQWKFCQIKRNNYQTKGRG